MSSPSTNVQFKGEEKRQEILFPSMLLTPKEAVLQGAGMLSVSLKFKFSSTQITSHVT